MRDGEMIAELRERHLGRRLLRAHRAFSLRAAQKLSEMGHSGVTLAHIALLPHLDEAGARATTLASRAGMTKQGIGQLVRDLEALGYLERAPDPTDGRASLVRFTKAGSQLLHDAVEVTQELDAELTSLIGPDRIDALREALDKIARLDADR